MQSLLASVLSSHDQKLGTNYLKGNSVNSVMLVFIKCDFFFCLVSWFVCFVCSFCFKFRNLLSVLGREKNSLSPLGEIKLMEI